MLKRRVALGLFTAFLGATAALLRAPAHGQPAPSLPAPATNASPEAAAPADPSSAASSSAAEPARQKLTERYQEGIVIWQTPDDATVPFLMKFNLNTQVRYLNTTDSEKTFTDHLGVVREGQHSQRHHGQPHDVHPRRPGQPIAGQHLPVLYGIRPEHGGQLLPSGLHSGNLGVW